MSSLERTAKHTFIYMLGLMANRGVAFLLVPLYTRTFEPSVFATWDLATTTIIFLVPLFELGMASALVRYYHQHDEERERKKAIGTAFVFVLCSSAVFSIGAFLFAPWLAAAIFGDASLGHLVKLIAVTISLTAVSNQFLALLRAQERSMAFSIVNLARAVVGPLMILLLILVFDFGLVGVLWGDIAGIVCMGAAGLWLTRRHLVFAISGARLKSMLAFGLPLIPWALTISIITLSDRYFLRLWTDLEELAIYSLGFKVGMIMTLFTRAFQAAWPASAYRIAKEDDAREQLADGGRYVFSASALLAAGLALAAPELVAIFGGSDFYAPAIHITPWIVFSYALYQLTLLLLIAITITHKNYYVTVLAVGAVFVKLVLSVALIPKFGAYGAALSTFGSFCMLLIFGYLTAQRVYYIPYPLKPVAILVTVIALFNAAAFLFVYETTPVHTMVRIAMWCVLVAVLPVSGLIDPDTIRRLGRAAWRRVPRRTSHGEQGINANDA